MKKYQLIAGILVVASLSACQNKKAHTCTGHDHSHTAVAANTAATGKPVALDNIWSIAANRVDSMVTIVGQVIHTCKHSGKRCFLVGESQSKTLRVEAKGEIGGFNRELVGSKIKVTGRLKERRLTPSDMDKMEKDILAKVPEDGSAEGCDTEMANIAEMRQWMKDQQKDYYPIYYVDGQKYTVLNE